jgi:hypothetical protein
LVWPAPEATGSSVAIIASAVAEVAALTVAPKAAIVAATAVAEVPALTVLRKAPRSRVAAIAGA